MQSRTGSELAQIVISKLDAEGVKAHIEPRQLSAGDHHNEIDGGDLNLRVPAWEEEDGSLSRTAFYSFIHAKLAGRVGKGLVASLPDATFCDVYCYYPESIDEGKTLDVADIVIWSTGAKLDQFSWDEVVQGDESAWVDGWEIPGSLGKLPTRLANLALLLNFEIVDLPPYNRS